MLVRNTIFSSLYNTAVKLFVFAPKTLDSGVKDYALLADDSYLSYTRAMLLHGITMSMLLLAFLINIAEGRHFILFPIFFVFFVSLALFVLLLLTKKSIFSLIAINLILIAFGVYLLCWECRIGDGPLFWFLLFPPVLLYCAGLRGGTIFFFIYYLFLLLFLLTPMDQYLASDLSWPTRLRFLGTVLGSFLFSLFAETARERIRRALLQTVHMLERSALTDPLTALGNRRDFHNYFTGNQNRSSKNEREKRSKKENRPSSLAIIDLDFFKRINDTFGHAAGDAVLCHVSKLLSSNLRPADRIFRWGGEEFVVLLPETGFEEAWTIMERLRHEAEITPCITESGQEISFTISIGLYSCSNINDDNVNTYLALADEQMYLAKNSGRNQVRG